MTESKVKTSTENHIDLVEAPIHVLSVDDDSGFLKITKQVLEVQGAFQVDTASSVDEAMDKLKKTTYDAIVSDYQMPVKDGLEFLKELRDNGNTIPFILFTGKGRESIAIEALNLGADGYFNKLGDPETVYGELVHGIRQVVEKKKAEEEVAKARDEYLSITNLTGDIIVNVDREGRWAFLNDEACMFWGKPREELLGKKFRDYLHPEDSEKTAASAIQETVETRQIVRGVINRQKTPKGWRTVEWNAAPLFDKSGEYVGMQATGRDITERKKAEEAIVNLARFPSENPNPVLRIAKDGVILYTNVASKSWLGTFGGKVGGLVSKEWVRHIADVLCSDVSKEVELAHKDQVFSFVFSPVVSAGYVNVYGRNITKRKITEQVLAESEEKYKGIFEMAPDGIITTNVRGVITSVNPAFLSLTGFSEDEIVGKHFTKIGTMRVRDIPRYLKLYSSILRGKTPPPIEFPYFRKDGTQGWGEAHSSVLKKGGKTVGFQAVLRDTTERMETSERNRASEERYRRLVELAPDGIVTLDVNGVITSQNTAASQISGYHSGDLIGKHFSTLGGLPTRDIPKMMELFTSAINEKETMPFEVNLLHKDGTPYVAEINIGILKENDKTVGLQVIFRDITERKKVEKALHESEERYRTLFESAREGIIITGPEGKISRMNKAAATILGYDSPEELVGIPAVELYLDPEDREAMFKEIMERGYVERYELTLKKKDGSPIHTLGSILTRKDPEGNRLQTEAFFMDITERKTREEEMKRRLMRFRLDDGNLYLVKESYPALSLEAFKDLLNVGYQGLVISRTHEEEFKKNVDDSFEFRWLAERGGEKSLSPRVEKIENSLEKSLKKSAILLDNLDYLILKNGFKKTLFFIQHLRELTYINHNIVILVVDPATLSAREIRLLEKESREIAPRVFVKLPEGLLEILRFIYEHNTQGSKPNYTDIRQELSISKPTVGKRIKILVNTGYVTENVRGSSKVLELTQKGIILFMK